MSEEIPLREVGDKIRINDCSSTRKRGIARKFGVVTNTNVIAPAGFYDVLYEIAFEDGQTTLVEGSVLFSDGRKK